MHGYISIFYTLTSSNSASFLGDGFFSSLLTKKPKLYNAVFMTIESSVVELDREASFSRLMETDADSEPDIRWSSGIP